MLIIMSLTNKTLLKLLNNNTRLVGRGGHSTSFLSPLPKNNTPTIKNKINDPQKTTILS